MNAATLPTILPFEDNSRLLLELFSTRSESEPGQGVCAMFLIEYEKAEIIFVKNHLSKGTII